jgi:TPR repeat protein
LVLLLAFAAPAPAPASPNEPAASNATSAGRPTRQAQGRWQNVSREELLKAAEAGDGEAQYQYGLREWSAAAADADRAIRQQPFKWTPNNMGPSTDERKAMVSKWSAVPEAEARQAAASGDSGAKYFLWKLDSDRAQERGRKAFEWFKKAAEQSVAPAESAVALAYLGRGWQAPPRDLKEGMKWLRKAIADGSEPAQHQLAIMLIEGAFLPVDVPEGIDRLRIAADQGCPRAQFELALQYVSGSGDPRSDGDTPVALLTKAATAGWGEAQFCLAERYRTGFGVQASPAKAFFWYDLAAAQRVNRAAEQRDQLKAQLTKDDYRQFDLWRKDVKTSSIGNSPGP